MFLRWRLGLLLVAAEGFSFAQSPPAVSSIAITDVNVIDVVNGTHRNHATVLMQAGRIVAIGEKIPIPRGATRVNGKGKYLIPGLWDMHAHHQATGSDAIDLFVAKGVTGTRDMGADANFILPLRDRIRSGELLGPEIVTSGPMVDNVPSYPYRLVATNAEQARAAVTQLKQLRVDFIKVHDHTPRDVFFTVAEEGPKVGLTVAGHIPSAVKVEEAVDAGVHSIEHLANYRVFDDCATGDSMASYDISACSKLFDKMAAKGVWQTPTLAFFQTIPDVFSGAPLQHAEYMSDSFLAATRRNMEHSKLGARELEAMRFQARVALQQAIPALAAHGNRFLAGCDGLAPGFCLHDELEWMTKARFSPLQALQTATINPALFMGREATQGTIDVGKRADVVVLDADPTVDIRNVTRISAVVLGGRLVTKPVIDRIVARHRRVSLTASH